MNCARVEILLPDLVDDGVDPELVAARAHLAGCERCAALADDFRASLDLARELSEPDADAAFYASIRRDVLARVAAERPARTWVRPLAIAASVALVALALLLAAQALRDRPEGATKKLVVEGPTTAAPPPAPEPAPAPEPRIVPDEPRPTPVADRRRRRTPRPTVERAAVEAPPEPAEMMRIEYQTSDPNVRIIWFVPKGDGASPETAKSGL